MEIKVVSTAPAIWVEDERYSAYSGGYYLENDDKIGIIDFPLIERGYGDLMFHSWSDFPIDDERLDIFYYLTKNLFKELEILVNNVGTKYEVNHIYINNKTHYAD